MDNINHDSKSSKMLSRTLITITGGMAIALTVGCIPFISPALRRICLPFVPATDTQVQNIMHVLSRRKGKMLDIGSGDGRVVIAAAKKGFTADGVELNPWLLMYSRLEAFRNGVHSQTQFYYRDLWKFDISSYENVVLFGVEEMMPDIEKKFSKQLSANAAVIVCRFPLPSKMPTYTYGTGIDTVWLYLNLKS